MFDHDQWADYYFVEGRRAGRLDGLIVGVTWGFLAGLTAAALFSRFWS
jgi:hypothetical protein